SGGLRGISMSWGLGVETPALRDAIEQAALRDVLVVAAAGNSGADNDKYPSFPACYGHEGCRAGAFFPNVVAVMATDRDDAKPGFSNYGAASVHLAAPGVDVVSAHQYFAEAPAPGGGSRYQRYDGTSAAAAYVSGVAALLKSRLPQKLSAEDIKGILVETSDLRDDLRCRAKGRVNIGLALRAIDPG